MVLLTSVNLSLASFAVLGNIVICILIRRNRAMQTPINYLLLNLAVVDITSETVTVISTVFKTEVGDSPTFISSLSNSTSPMLADVICKSTFISSLFNSTSPMLADVICKSTFISSLSNSTSPILPDAICKSPQAVWFSADVSPTLLMVIAFERFFAVVYPLKQEWRISYSRLKWLVPICWLVGIAIIAPDLYGDGFRDGMCMEKYPTNLKIVQTLWKKDEEVAAHISAAAIRLRKKRKRKTVAAILAMKTIFYVIFGFNTLCNFLDHVPGRRVFENAYSVIYVALFIFNSAVNPVIYITSIESFRQEFLRILRCGAAGGQVVPSVEQGESFQMVNLGFRRTVDSDTREWEWAKTSPESNARMP
ncbi:predicted protein [Nematostella vectensis]|uniref:G-protein coupled receptors family 1 profile domain-containing protein n=1 Tax=Nematostella vectensis TaxID=45351 RepID=A7S5H4_NEMVE|nr:predicted protein [Nematostella vectensis]|eukprot:XP_001633040.1 predicted protein [Nematostella vectensis]